MSGRRRRRGGGPPPDRPVLGPAPGGTEADPPVASEPAPRPFGGLFRGALPSPLPSIPGSLARGFVAASHPAICVPALLLVPLLWFGLVAAGLQGPPARMVAFLAIPPISTGFDFAIATDLLGTRAGLLAALASIPLRGLVVALFTGLLVEALERGGAGRAGLRRGLRAWPVASFTTVLGLGILMVGNVVFGFLGAGLNLLASILAPVAALFFFAYAPAAAVRQRWGLVETVRRSARAALIPGSRHLLLSMLYVVLSLPFMILLAPQGGTITVNPSFAAWAYALVAAFVHLGFAGAFAYRWLAAEPLVPEEPVRRSRGPGGGGRGPGPTRSRW
ncbi:MAG TPA: hypothetical protein VNO17_08125 [Actinomycetota bacterium]|nr:hypothetical protein [Actinomycetota bacterium]